MLCCYAVCSFYDNEEICKHEEYAGTRAERGLFITRDGRKVNADINGALNILRKSKTKTDICNTKVVSTWFEGNMGYSALDSKEN